MRLRYSDEDSDDEKETEKDSIDDSTVDKLRISDISRKKKDDQDKEHEKLVQRIMNRTQKYSNQRRQN